MVPVLVTTLSLLSFASAAAGFVVLVPPVGAGSAPVPESAPGSVTTSQPVATVRVRRAAATRKVHWGVIRGGTHSGYAYYARFARVVIRAGYVPRAVRVNPGGARNKGSADPVD